MCAGGEVEDLGVAIFAPACAEKPATITAKAKTKVMFSMTRTSLWFVIVDLSTDCHRRLNF
jgi:hypothetical protein